jgi:hypothetical protein
VKGATGAVTIEILEKERVKTTDYLKAQIKLACTF